MRSFGISQCLLELIKTFMTSEKDPAKMLPLSVEVPYEPKPPVTSAEKEKMFRTRNLHTFKRTDPKIAPAEIKNIGSI
jgi:hypothetical protein